MIHHLQHTVDLVEICSRKNIRHVVVSPGSRNAPLLRCFHQGNFSLHSIVDERSAAFYALGLSLATHEPVALICTSGTAVLNYAPALAEAYYQRVPLVAITADRPENLIDQQDNQTIRQANVYTNYVKDSIHLRQPVTSRYELELQHHAINKIINTALTGQKGPVHINVPMAEPLYDELPTTSDRIKSSEAAEEKKAEVEHLIEDWKKSRKKIILCGQSPPDSELNYQLNRLSSDALVFAEPLSNVSGTAIIGETDRLMMLVEQNKDESITPDMLITLGGPVVSKRLKLWLQKQNKLVHYRLSPEDDGIDTYGNLTSTLVGDVKESLKLLNVSDNDEHYTTSWGKYRKQAANRHQQALAETPFSDLHVFQNIIKNIPNGTTLHLGNSSPVRYAQLFDIPPASECYSNRGVSGIDGCVSTAAGIAKIQNKPNLILTGDLSFIYDSNALWNKDFPQNLKIIVINNQGGGIFRMIPGPSNFDAFEEFMETRHPVDIKKLVQAFGLHYHQCSDEKNLELIIKDFLQSKTSPSLLEVKTPKYLNAQIYSEYVRKIKLS